MWLCVLCSFQLMCVVVDEDIDKAALMSLTDSLLVPLLPKIGQRARFMAQLAVLQNKVCSECLEYRFVNADVWISAFCNLQQIFNDM